MKGQPFFRRFAFALNGLRLAFCRESSLRFHVLAGAAVLLGLWFSEASALWWAIAGVTVGLVIMAELFNAALETLTDHLHPEVHPEIAAAKDIAAGAVLAAALAAVWVALAYIFH